MSLTSKHASHRRSDSGELAVFEAERYFSGADEIPGRRATARMSLDMTAIASQNPPTIQNQYMKKKYKQPSSPGARLASFINSIFNHTNSKKKNKSKTSSDDHDHTLDRRRRSSISHFRIAADCDSKSRFPASNTTSYHTKTPAKSSYEDLKSFSCLHKNGNSISASNGSYRYPSPKWTVADEDRREFGDLDEGEDSDSSSDLFDLPNLDNYSSGLPVYGTTNMGRIRIRAPISSGTTV